MRDLFAKLRSTRTRAVLALGVFFLFAASGTLAYWTSSATVPGATFQAGKFDLKINTVDNFTESFFTNVQLAPGESVAYDVTLTNAGDANLTWTATGSSTVNQLSGAMTYQLFVKGGTAASNSPVGTFPASGPAPAP